ncbi:MAG: MotA/TolQ/ExbB proton channel family protein [Thermoguttaceae bacterium]|jgi:biopolymer transport protein ExbB/TolQ
MTTFNRYWRAITASPIVWGILGTAVFYGLVHRGPLGTPFIERYFTHHPVEYGETLMFAVGLSALLLRALDVARQYAALGRPLLGNVSPANGSVDDQCRTLLGNVDGLSLPDQEGYHARRIRSAIEFVRRAGSPEGLRDELKYLADADAGRSHKSYALFRVIVWAIPILGFLGTVIGITMALNALDPNALDESMQTVTRGLGVKFDTTALALAMSMLLMFAHFFVERADSALLEAVDIRAEAELSQCFPQLPAGPDGQVVAMRRMAEVMVVAAERLVQRQAELWQASMEAAAARWLQGSAAAAGEVQKVLAPALAEALQGHAQHLAAAEQAAAEQNRRHWEKLAGVHAQNVQALAALQNGLNRQAEVLERAIHASGEVARLEDALNRNLTALSGAKHFEQTVLGLAATIHLLNARLAESPAVASVQLASARRTSQAA